VKACALNLPPLVEYKERVSELQDYKQQALKLAQVKFLGRGEGYSAKISGFAGLIVFGDTKAEALSELESALDGWIEVSLRRGDGLPALRSRALAAA
jgi:predicted RNase H-like HicB family nuclease